MRVEMLAAALEYHRRGWSILPMRMQAKRPKVRWKRFQEQRAAESTVQKWFGGGADVGVGVVFGAVSGGLASRDFDQIDGYHRWAAEHAELARLLPTVETRRGRHVYGRADATSMEVIRRRLGKPDGTGAIDCGDGELRAGVGCYSVLPPSRHPEGAKYRWLVPLPDGPLPLVDPVTAGWLDLARATERHRGEQRKTEEIREKVEVESEAFPSKNIIDDIAWRFLTLG